jgi:uncharacterized protein (DUF305 family)
MKINVTALFAGCVLLLAGCASGGTAAVGPTSSAPSPPPARPSGTGAFNDTDVMFLQMMVPHHGQGLTIVRLAKTKATSAEVRTLAAAIESTQAAEIETMSGWLRAWRQPGTANADAHAAHGGMPGTTAAEIYALKRTAGADFERRFLNMLIAHQDDAIQLARMEVSTGINQGARDLAQQIDRSRSAQIEQMLKLLQSADPSTVPAGVTHGD